VLDFLRARPALRKAIAELLEVLVIALVSKTVMPIRVPTGQVFSHKLGVFASDSYSTQAVVSSNLHQIWAVKYGSTMRTDVNYSPSDAFETFPRPDLTERLGDAGQALPDERRAIMLRRDLGLTKLYNLVNEPAVRADKDVDQLRAIHIEVDEATMDADGWDDIHLDHGFHTYRHVERWTVSPAARVEILDRHPRSSTRQETVSGSNVNAWT